MAADCLLSSCRKLPDAFVPVLMAEAQHIESLESVFLQAWVRDDEPVAEQVREAARWFYGLQYVNESAAGRKRIASLASVERAVSAAQAAIVRFPNGRDSIVSVLAAEGSAESADALLPMIHAAAEAGDARLDRLVHHLLPFAAGAVVPAVSVLTGAQGSRGAASPVAALLPLFGATGNSLSLQVHLDSEQRFTAAIPKAQVVIMLDSSKLPAASVWLRKLRGNEGDSLSWGDGVTSVKHKLIAGPKDVTDLPKWLAKIQKPLALRWNPVPSLVLSSLRGKARTNALKWLTSALPS